jgi:hypothetical protein
VGSRPGTRRECDVIACALIAACFLPSTPTVIDHGWAGYAWTSRAGTYRHVATTFTVPTAECSLDLPRTLLDTEDTAEWAGLDGYSNRTVEQTGVNEICSPWGYASYTAWWELWPAAPVFVATPVRPGEVITLSVTYRAGAFTFTGAGWAVTRPAPRGIKRESAEVITEAANGPVVPFAPITFTVGPHPGVRHRIALRDRVDGSRAIPGQLSGGRFVMRWEK